MLEAEVGVEPRSLGSLNELLQVVMSLSPLQRDVMGFWKFLPFLVLSFLAVYQAGMLQAAPFR